MRKLTIGEREKRKRLVKLILTEHLLGLAIFVFRHGDALFEVRVEMMP